MENISDLKHQIYSESPKQQLKSVSQLLEEGEAGRDILMQWMISVEDRSSNFALGKAYQSLYSLEDSQVKEFLASNFSEESICSVRFPQKGLPGEACRSRSSKFRA